MSEPLTRAEFDGAVRGHQGVDGCPAKYCSTCRYLATIEAMDAALGEVADSEETDLGAYAHFAEVLARDARLK